MISGAEPARAESAPSKEEATSIWEWFFLPPGFVPLIARLTALSALPCGFLFLIAAQNDPASYVVPTWRFGTWLLEIPPLALPVTIAIFAVYAISCLWLTFGPFHKLPVAIAALTMAYFGSRDLMASHCSFVVVVFTFLIALLFAHKERLSCTRRLIQVSTIAVYFYSVLWKVIFPEFMNGESYAAQFADGWAIKTIWVPLLTIFKPDLLFWQISAWLTILLESFIAFGLAYKPWRKWALIAGLVLHAGIAIFLDKEYILTIFSIIMCTGYLAFVEPPLQASNDQETSAGEETQESSGGAPSSKEESVIEKPIAQIEAQSPDLTPVEKQREGMLAALFGIVMLLVPLRILFWPDRPVNSVYLFDRSPWNFSMFLMRIEFESVNARYKDASNNWHTVFESKRDGSASGLESKTWTRSAQTTMSTDNQMIMVANKIFASYKEAEKVEITSEYVMNKRYVQKKILTMSKNATPSITVYNPTESRKD